MAPLFTEADAPLLKTYIIARLESASEADPDVLSDYILALLRHDQTPAEVMSTCITQLADFMTSGIGPFLTIFQAPSRISLNGRSNDVCEGYFRCDCGIRENKGSKLMVDQEVSYKRREEEKF